MTTGTVSRPAHAGKKWRFWKVLGILALLAIAGRTIHVLLFGFTATMSETNILVGRRIGAELGAAIFVFLVGAAGASFEAFMNRRKGFPLAGITTGTIFIVVMTAVAISAAMFSSVASRVQRGFPSLAYSHVTNCITSTPPS